MNDHTVPKRRFLLMILAVFSLPVLGPAIGPAMAQVTAPVGECPLSGTFPTGASYLIVMPEPGHWNGDLLIYAHGFVPPGGAPAIVDNTIDGRSISEIVTSLGYAFATTSYRTNGLAIADGVADLVDLTQYFSGCKGQPRHTLLAEASEGGLVTALAVEKRPDLFGGGLALCGPVGDFRKQINYFGDVLVLFNYFFPGVLSTASPAGIPGEILT